jgi:hypothetical protein
LPFHIQEIINYIPVGITLFIFFAFLKSNKNVKEFEAGPIKYKAKDDSINKSAEKQIIKNRDKDIEQDNTIKTLFEKLENIETALDKNSTENKKRHIEINTRLDKQYEFIREAVLKSCAAMVFTNDVPLIEFFDAVFMSLYLGANGNTISRVTKRIIKSKENLETYNSELAKFRQKHKNTNNHFENAIKQIHSEWH